MGLQEDNNREKYVSNISNLGTVINSTGHTYFVNGIPYIEVVRGINLFSEAESEFDVEGIDYETEGSTVAQMLGSDIDSRLTTIGNVFNLPGYIIGFLCIIACFTMVVVRGIPLGHSMAGVVIASLFLFIGMYTGLVLYVWIAMAVMICLFFIIWSLVITKA